MKRVLIALVAVLTGVTGCSDPDESGVPPNAASSTPVEFNQALHHELVAMAEQDQEERTGDETMNDEPRTERLAEIIAERGWPTYDLVGKEGGNPAEQTWLAGRRDPG